MDILLDLTSFFSAYFSDTLLVLSTLILLLILLLLPLKVYLNKKQLEGYIKQEDYQALESAVDASINELRTILSELLKRQQSEQQAASAGQPKQGGQKKTVRRKKDA